MNGNQETRKTWPKYFTNDPIIEQGFVMLVRNPLTETISVRVLDAEKGDKEIGQTSINVWSLIQQPDMEYDMQPWILKGSGPDSRIVMVASIVGLLPPTSTSGKTGFRGTNSPNIAKCLKFRICFLLVHCQWTMVDVTSGEWGVKSWLSLR